MSEPTGFYAGVGSRDTPQWACDLFFDIGKLIGASTLSLRSGGARGADQAFEKGCDAAMGFKEIYLGFENFENRSASESRIDLHRPVYNLVCNRAMVLAERFHPNWKACSDWARCMLARDGYQVLGLDLATPSKFILCWTPNAAEVGGTSQALRIAAAHNIPVWNAGKFPGPEGAWESALDFLAANA